MTTEKDLIVRRFERHELVLPAILSVAPEHQALVRFNPSICERDGWIPATLADISPGGLGLITQVFIPRMSLMRVRVMRGEDERQVLDVKVRLQRICMTDRRPAYLLGTAFVELSDEQKNVIQTITAELDGEQKSA
ncbi:MAG: PilZ domain-containing protein [Phycisphaerales bacterium]|nr:PilZ domain-containing protein [Phycisphaerales bacterium]